MKKGILFSLLFVVLVMSGISCVGPKSSRRLKLTVGDNVPARFVQILELSPKTIKFQVNIAYANSSMYHIIADEDDRFIAEGWVRTSRDGTGKYMGELQLKEDESFQPGQRYQFCIGTAHPDKVYLTSSNYRCEFHMWFTYPEEK